MSRFRVLASLFGLLGLLICSAAHADLYSAQQAYDKKDFVQAFALYREIAEMGHPVGQETLAVMYVNGEGVKRDNVLGYGWALIANENSQSDIALNIISQLEPHLTDAARQRVAELQAQFGRAALQERLLPEALHGPDDLVLHREAVGAVALEDAHAQAFAAAPAGDVGATFEVLLDRRDLAGERPELLGAVDRQQ